MTRFTLWRLDRSKVRVRHVAGRVSPVIGQCHDQRHGEAARHDEEASQRRGDESDTT